MDTGQYSTYNEKRIERSHKHNLFPHSIIINIHIEKNLHNLGKVSVESSAVAFIFIRYLIQRFGLIV